MLNIGRYKVAFGRVVWFQTRGPTRIWHFLWFWFFKEARPGDVDKKQQFPIGTPMEYEGRIYRYCKAGEGTGKHKTTWRPETECQEGVKDGEV